MKYDDLLPILQGLQTPRGLAPLLRLLGFTGPLVRRPFPAPSAVRRLRCTTRGTVTLHVAALRSAIDPAALHDLRRAARNADGVSHHLFLVTEPGHARVAVACDTLGAGLRHIVVDPRHVRASDVEVLAELAAPAGEGDTALMVRVGRALDRARLSDRFFRDVAGVRDVVAREWIGLPGDAFAQREALALLLLSRLMFLYFLQRQGLLAGDPNYLRNQFAGWRQASPRASFFRRPLHLLFFGVLNRRPERRTDAARRLGPLPYLNGGLFERHRLERECPGIDLPDSIMVRVMDDLLEKYRFTTTDAAQQQADGDVVAIDPEMLGRIFEGLMPGDARSRTGTFYTPSAVVDRLVGEALAQHLAIHCGLSRHSADLFVRDGDVSGLPSEQAACVQQTLADVRVLDPACGSGAFLLGALSRLARLRPRCGTATDISDVRHDIVARSLHGVDLLEDAALICSLRLWLALVPHAETPADVPPLPNLDRRIRQGDALVDPLDIGADLAGRPVGIAAPAELRSLLRELQPAAGEYLGADPETRPVLRRKLRRLEAAVASAWLKSFEAQLRWDARELAARSADIDLFGAPAAHARSARRQLLTVQRRQQEMQAFGSSVTRTAHLPFFSFRVHFADAQDGFDIILSNPPWVRSHKWPPQVRELLRERYRVCDNAGWPFAAELSGMPAAAGSQVDLSLLFLERSARLLADRGTLGMLLPAKLFRSLYAAGARQLLLRDLRVTAIEDHSLDHRAVFAADAFTAVVLATKAGNATGAAVPVSSAQPVRVTLCRAAGDSLLFHVPHDELPLRVGDQRSPWLLVPPECRTVLRQMQRGGPLAGEELTIRRGAMTGSNDVLVIRDLEPGIGDLARIRTEGYHRAGSAQARRLFAAWVEASCVRPALRGSDVAAWNATVSRHVVWVPANGEPGAGTPPRMSRFLQRHRSRLGDCRSGPGALHRLSPHTTGNKVVWSDLACDMRAAAVPAETRNSLGVHTPIIPLNTIYFMATKSEQESLLLAAYLNSLPLRVFARAIAERAKDAHFRFFAWTVAMLPLPRDWRVNACARQLTELSREAHLNHGISSAAQLRLDVLVARSYGISESQMSDLQSFDAWLRGESSATRAAA